MVKIDFRNQPGKVPLLLKTNQKTLKEGLENVYEVNQNDYKGLFTNSGLPGGLF